MLAYLRRQIKEGKRREELHNKDSCDLAHRIQLVYDRLFELGYEGDKLIDGVNFLAKKITALTAENERLKRRELELECIIGGVCPEDVSLVEYVTSLRKQLAEKDKLIELLANRIRESNKILAVPRTGDSGMTGIPVNVITDNEAALAAVEKEIHNCDGCLTDKKMCPYAIGNMPCGYMFKPKA